MRIRLLAVLLVFAVFAPRPASLAAAIPIDPEGIEPECWGPAGRDSIPLVIVTTRALRAEFTALARAHRRRGLDARVWTVESIRRHVSGRDDAERIRSFLAER